MKYPIDPLTTETFFGHLIANDRAQRQTIQALTALLMAAMSEMGADDTDWFHESTKLFKIQAKIKADHDTRIFNARNGHNESTTIRLEGVNEIGRVEPKSEVTYVPGIVIDPEMNAQLNEQEKAFGEEMTEAEIAAMFREKPKQNNYRGGVDMNQKEPFKGMTLEEIENWEKDQENSNDIYKIKARVANLAVGISGGHLTPVGVMMVNSFVHVVKDLYAFADTIPDRSLKIALHERIRKHESMPGTLIAAASSGVTMKKG